MYILSGLMISKFDKYSSLLVKFSLSIFLFALLTMLFPFSWLFFILIALYFFMSICAIILFFMLVAEIR